VPDLTTGATTNYIYWPNGTLQTLYRDQTAIDRDHYKRCFERSTAAFHTLWRAFLLLCCQFVVVAIAAVWGWAR
jgi:hypothetical protein